MKDTSRPTLSIVVPAYNEAVRLPATLDAIERFVRESGLPAEVIVADDGSDDDTALLAETRVTTMDFLRVLRLPHRGKAHAVREGILAAEGQFVLFTDADLSTPMSYALDLLQAVRTDAEVAIGSREGIGASRVGEPGYRHLMGRIFNAVVKLLAVPGINDTQCGFKLFEQDAARAIFSRTRLHTGEHIITGPRVTGFDVEVLYLARRLGYRVAEVPVHWEHVSGSKVRPLLDSFRMFGDVLLVRRNAILRRYD